MADGPEWFAQKRYGYGAGLPISWQGWAITITYVGLMIVAARLLANTPLALIGIIVPATVLFVFIAAKTTRGGWRWRWGAKDRDD